MKPQALVIDDDALSREFLAEALRTSGYAVEEAADGPQGLKLLGSCDPELVVTDLRMPGQDGLSVLRDCRERRPELAVVVMTAYGTIEGAVEAMRLGAEDFLVKPVSPEQIDVMLERIARRRALEHENEVLRARLPQTAPDVGPLIVGEDPALRRALALAERVAVTDATVLVRGESGTGKELVAELLHCRSHRKDGPFIRVNCAALTESLLTSELFGHEKGSFTGADSRKAGRFELARGGTLFLDEIGEVPLEVQAKLLRVLESGEFERVGGTRTLESDVRVVAATNRDLEAAMKEGRFREDLFYRLDVLPVRLPPLRERIGDVPALADLFLQKFRKEHGGTARELSPESLMRLRSSDWPGNVRELANVIQRAVLTCMTKVIEPVHLGLPGPEERRDTALPVGMTLEEMERRMILQTLDATGWNRSEAARVLGVTARTLSNKLKLWRIRGLIAAEGSQ